MKKYLSLLLAAMLVMSLCACGGNSTPTNSEAPASDVPASEAPASEAPAEESVGIAGMKAEAVFTAYAAEPYSIPTVEGEAADNTTVYTSANAGDQRGADGFAYQISVDAEGNIAEASITLTSAEEDAETLKAVAMEFFSIAVLNPYDTGDEAGLAKWLKINLPNADEAGKYLVKGEARFDLFKTDGDGETTYTLTIVKH